MKAIILAAGKGERLKEITKSIPKPMILYKGKPILQYNLELCKKYGIKDFYFNLHHHPEHVKNYFGDGKDFGVTIHYSYEDELLGTSGAVKKIAKELWNLSPKSQRKSRIIKFNQADSPFFVIYGDQLSYLNLSLLIEKFNEYNPVGVIAFHYREDVEHSGVAEFEKDNRIINFIEKPQPGMTESHWVNAGVYCLSTRILNYIPDGFSDFGRQIFPDLLNKKLKLFGVCENKEVKVFDTLEMYNKSFGNSDCI